MVIENNKKNQKGMICILKIKDALAGVAQWIECRPANQKVAGLIPCQGTCLGCGPGPQLRLCEKQPRCISHTSMFLSLSPSFPLSLRINK